MTAIGTNDETNPAHCGSLGSGLANKLVSAANGVDYAYRDTGPGANGGPPLVLLQHFRGNLDNWDPALIDSLASRPSSMTLVNRLPANCNQLVDTAVTVGARTVGAEVIGDRRTRCLT